MFTIYKTTSFESAHLLEGHPKCGKLHGHSYKAEFWVTTGALVKPYGFVLDFHTLSDIVKQYDHSDVVIKVSCETLCKDIAEQVSNKLENQTNVWDARVKVRIWETATSYAEYEMQIITPTP